MFEGMYVSNVCDGVCMLLEAVRGCAALVGTIIQLERQKCLCLNLS